HGLSPHLRKASGRSLRGEGQRRVDIRSVQQNLEAVGAGSWISRLCPFQIRRATGSPLLCRCPTRNLGIGFRQATTSSITSSARANSAGGISRPSALVLVAIILAVLMPRGLQKVESGPHTVPA